MITEFKAPEEEENIEEMTTPALRDAKQEVEELIARLEELEPENISSKEYYEWLEEMDSMEELLEDICDELSSRK